MTHRSAFGSLLIISIVAAIVGCGMASQTAPGQSSVASEMEDFAAEKLDDYLGQVVVVNFWATWCLPCRSEMPSLEAVYQKFRESGVIVLGVNVSDTSDQIVAFAREHRLTFPMLRDPRQQAARSLGIRMLPTTLILDQFGELQHRILGATTASQLSEQIEAVLE